MSQTIEPRGNPILIFQLNWQSAEAGHQEMLYAHTSLWGDLLPPRLGDALVGMNQGETLELEPTSAEAVPLYSQALVKELKPYQFAEGAMSPRQGRFYPRRLLSGVPGLNPASLEPFRCVRAEHHGFSADLNHPLAGAELKLAVTVEQAEAGDPAQPGVDWIERLCQGPGMQARPASGVTDFLGGDALLRQAEGDDAEFYDKPRLVGHVDSLASSQIGELYGGLISPGSRVLDLMAAYQSHLPEGLELAEVVGLGMNAQEMEANPRLDSHLVHDLNQQPELPFEDESFDAVVCTASVEYLIQPLEVFAGVARVLKPGGVFALTFSNRFFEPKTVNLWRELHDFEKVGLVLDYFLQHGGFEDLGTLSRRGWPRPADDRHYGEYPTADPVYAVWGRLRG